MEYNKKEILDLYASETNKTYVAQKYCELKGVEFKDGIRRTISKIINSEIVDSDLENETSTDTQGYKSELSNMPSAWCAEKGRFYSIEEYCDTYGLDKNSVKSSKLVSHNQAHMVYNIAFFTDDEEAVLNVNDHLDEIVSKYIKPIKSIARGDIIVSNEWFDRLVYTDVHINMDVNGKHGDPLYDGKWDRDEIMRRLDLMIQHVITFKKSNTLVISCLGDFMDGMNAQTTRKGHELPQNTNDKEAFELGLEFKLKLIDSLIDYFDEIICYNICNDNHSFLFGYFVSSASAKILNERYKDKVKVITVNKFINHFSIGNHTFVELHGKDAGEMKFGFKPKLDAIQADKLDQYCKENKLYNGNFIEVAKGDSHQALYDDATSRDFAYYNYPAFSPPSNWVKINFGNSRSGFRFYNIKRDENIKIAIPYWF